MDFGLYMTYVTYIFPAPVSGTCVIQIWHRIRRVYQKPAPVRTLFYSKPESGVHVAEMKTYDWSMTNGQAPPIRFNVFCYFRRQKFSLQSHMVWKVGAENGRHKLESIYGAIGAGFCSVRLNL